MLGTIVNAAVVVLGALIGIFLRSRLSEKYNRTVTQGLGLCVLVIGLSTALETENMILVIVSVAVGAILGTLLNIEGRLERLGNRLQARFAKGKEDSGFSKGFVSASLLFCVGAMAVVGSLDAGLRGDHSTLLAKSVLDFVSSIFLAGTYGAGVMLSAVSILLYQGSITLLARVVEPVLTTGVITEMSAVGGVLILGIGLNMLRREHIAVGNLLPGLLLPLLTLLF